MKKYFLFLVIILAAAGASAQNPLPRLPGTPRPMEESEKGDRLDSILNLMHRKTSHTRPYSAVITKDAVAHPGIFTVYAVRDSFFVGEGQLLEVGAVALWAA